MAGLEGNPFADPFQQTNNSTPTNTAQPQQPSGYGGTAQSMPVRPAQATVPISEEELFRQQEELRRREQELIRRQQDLDNRARQQQRAGNGQRPPHNWPPLPKIIPLEPCFYQDIDVEIPAQFQETVRLVYYVYLIYVLALSSNVMGALFYFLFAGGGFGLMFLSIIQLILFTPCAFLLWFRPVYKAFRDDSSFNFMMFFLVLFFHTIFCLVQMLGLSYAVGWTNTIEAFKDHWFIGLIMLVPTFAFTVAFAGMCLSLFKVHSFYRGNGTGFSINKARQEFSNGVMSDRNVQNAANQAARAAAAHAVNEMVNSGGRY
uniref:Secretory carrier-associated membrane protein n=3 Tax=Meloidogyne TaxID=189290 RepID=A0A914LTF4_MELIC